MGLGRVARFRDSCIFVYLCFGSSVKSYGEVLKLPGLLAVMGCSCNSTEGASITILGPFGNHWEAIVEPSGGHWRSTGEP